MDSSGFYGDTFSDGWGSFYPAKRSYSDNIFQECQECGLLFANSFMFCILQDFNSLNRQNDMAEKSKEILGLWYPFLKKRFLRELAM